MTSHRSSGAFKPFSNLKQLLEKQNVPDPPPAPEPAPDLYPAQEETIDDQTLFRRAMRDVKPIARGNRLKPRHGAPPATNVTVRGQSETLDKLRRLIQKGEGFVVSDTPEYVEGAGINVNPVLVKRLHRGDYSIQAFIDLHGLTVAEAQEALEHFLQEAVQTGKRGVLIIHGRGLSSPAEPVLKTNVVKWLTTGYWRKWVIAFSSARSCDGGTGATYVLLRQRPLTKRDYNNK
jgi:DNA-nicking Smr family endonuclease